MLDENNKEPETILVVTALVEEHRAIVELMTGSQALESITHEFSTQIGENAVRIICLSGMGNVNSAVRTTKLIFEFRPRYVVLCGIAGGIRSDDLALGDIIVGEQTVLYEASKVTQRRIMGVPLGFETQRRLWSFPAGDTLLRTARHLQITSWPEAVVEQAAPLGRLPQVTFGPIASGEKVVADSSFLTPIVQSYPLLKGIEMEGGGVAAAAHAAPFHCESLIVKSICDWADHLKNDGWHKASAYASATFVKALVGRLSDSRESLRTIEEIQPQPSVRGVFIEFLNPESQRIYGLDATEDQTRARIARATVNAALILCPLGTVFPIGTILETPYLQSLLLDSMPLLTSGKVRLSMREDTVAEFLAKRRASYEYIRDDYPALFEQPLFELPAKAFVRKEAQIGKRIAQAFRQGPGNLEDWRAVEALYGSEQVTLISTVPEKLLGEGKPVTWVSVTRALQLLGISPSIELRKLLQLTYCNIYISEYELEYLRNVDHSPFEFVPASAVKRYDFGALRRVLDSFGLWNRVSQMTAEELLDLLASAEYASFAAAYEVVFGVPVSDGELSKLASQLRAASDSSAGRVARKPRQVDALIEGLTSLRSKIS